MPFYSCTVNEIGPAADGTETSDPVVYVNLTDTQGSFAGQWFYAADGSQSQMLAVGLTAMNTNRQVEVAADPPNAGGSPYTSVSRMYLTLASTALISPVLDLAGAWQPTGLQGQAVISVNANYLSIDMSAFGRTTAATGTIVDRSDIVVYFPSFQTTNPNQTHPAQTITAQLQAPKTIAWSNGTVWQKV
jgi:hypothetical protein